MYKIEATFIYTKELLTLVKGNSKKFKCSNKLLTANYADCCEIKATKQIKTGVYQHILLTIRT